MRVEARLAHGHTPWPDVSVDEYIERCRTSWRAYVAQVGRWPTVSVCDGLFFHGNMTDLRLMDADRPTLTRYAHQMRGHGDWPTSRAKILGFLAVPLV